MEIENVYIDIDDLSYDDRVGQWVVAKVDLDRDEVADIEDMDELIQEMIDEAVSQKATNMKHDREVAVDDAVMNFVQGLLDAAAGHRPRDAKALRVLEQLRAL